MNLTPNTRAAHWTARYVGRPWAVDFTCWHLVHLVQLEVFRRMMPPLDVLGQLGADEMRDLIERCAWRRVAFATDGDIMVMRGPDGAHVGVVALLDGAKWLLHNLGGVDTPGSVRRDRVADLGRLGYGRFELWGPPQ